MKSPVWEPSPGALVSFLRNNLQAIPADLFTITLLSGTVLRYSGIDVPLSYSDVTYGIGPLISRGKVRRGVGVSVDTLDVKISADDSVTISGTPMIRYMARGGFDGATLRLNRLFMNDANVARGVLPVFFGRIGQVRTGLNRAQLEVRSHSELLDVMVPGEVYQPGCRNTLFDGRCKLNRNSFKASKSVAVGSTATQSTFEVSTSGMGSVGSFDLGVATITSGANAGQSRTIRRQYVSGSNHGIEVVAPWGYPVTVGTTVDLFQGCNKTKTRCESLGNLAHFRAEPFVPAPETVL